MKQDRLNKLQYRLKEVVTVNLLRETQDIQSQFWIITVNSVKFSVDGRYLDILVSSIKNSEELTKALSKYSQVLKQAINKKITLRIMPIIRFRYDDNMEKTTDILSKIDNLDIQQD